MHSAQMHRFYSLCEQTLIVLWLLLERQQWHGLFMKPVAAGATVLTTFHIMARTFGGNKDTVENPFQQRLGCFGFHESTEWIEKCWLDFPGIVEWPALSHKGNFIRSPLNFPKQQMDTEALHTASGVCQGTLLANFTDLVRETRRAVCCKTQL